MTNDPKTLTRTLTQLFLKPVVKQNLPLPLGEGRIGVSKQKKRYQGEGIKTPFVIFNLTLILLLAGCAGKKAEPIKTVKVKLGSIKAEIPTTGIVQPRNRLEIKPPVAGRIEKVLVNEGQRVYKGQILAQLSSSDRAALLDAARAKGSEELAHWEDVYKPAPIIAPLSGFIIQRAVEPGQTVSASDSVLVMADRLIIKAQVDETDIGSVKVGQNVELKLDAYPENAILGKVEHIAYESTVVSNVNIYEVDVLPESVPDYFRAGMSATINFVLNEKKDVLVLPINVVKKVGKQAYVFIKEGEKFFPKQITIGLENTLNIEVDSTLKEGDEVAVPTTEMIKELNAKFQNQRGPRNPLQKRN